jgi:hypothetical protein
MSSDTSDSINPALELFGQDECNERGLIASEEIGFPGLEGGPGRLFGQALLSEQ